MSKIIKVLSEPIFRGMYENLKETSGDNQLQTIQQAHVVVNKSAVELKDLLSSYSFTDQLEEIHFYKNLLPIVNSELYYYKMLYDLIAHKPFGNSAKIKRYYRKEMNKHQKYFRKNQEFINYYLLQQTHMDSVYFTKDTPSPLPPDIHLGRLEDESTATFYSSKLAYIQAVERIIDFIAREHNCLKSPKLQKLKKEGIKFIWTDSKISLIEIVYAFHAKGAINNGNTNIGQLIKFFETVFGIDLGNHYAGFHQNMKKRAMPRTSYLKKLKDILDYFMEDDEEKS